MAITAFTYLKRLADLIGTLDTDQIDRAIELIRLTWEKGKQIICFGNGGSALTANHFINDWNKSIFLSTGKPFHGRSLCENTGLIMSYANDISYESVFVEQLKNILEEGDLAIGISGSGNSENVIRAINYAKERGNTTLGLCGYSGGKLKIAAQYAVWINMNDMQLSEDLHFVFGHIVMQALCEGKC